MLDTNTQKTIAAALVISAIMGGSFLLEPATATTYDCYFWKLSQDKDIIICNYPGTNDMYHSYFKEKDMQTSMIQAGATYTFTGKHPSNLTYDNWNKTKGAR